MKNISDDEWEDFISHYPVYSSGKKVPYNFVSRTVYDHEFVTPFDVIQSQEYLFIDNSTLLDSHIILGMKQGVISFSTEFIDAPSQNSSNEICIKLTEDIILHDQLVVDGFVFTNSPRARAVAKIFSDVIKPICFSHHDRVNLHDYVYHGYEDFISKFEEYSKSDDTFHDGKNRDLNFFSSWWSENTARNEIILTPPTEKDLFLDIAIPVYLRDSENHGYRSAYYLAISEFCDVPYSPHPHRQLVLGSLLFKKQITETMIVEYFEKNVRDEIQHQEDIILRSTATIKAPLIFSYVLGLMNKGASYSNAVRDTRKMKSAIAFRKWCRELTCAVKAGQEGTRDKQKLLNELESECNKWKKDLDEGYKYKTRSMTLGLTNSVISAQINQLRDPILWKGKKGLLFLNDMLRASKRKNALHEGREQTSGAKVFN